MPYISKEARQDLAFNPNPVTPGELNYLITMTVLDYLGSDPNYQRFNDAVGALECAKMELFRRKINPFEDQKLKENGDVYA